MKKQIPTEGNRNGDTPPDFDPAKPPSASLWPMRMWRRKKRVKKTDKFASQTSANRQFRIGPLVVTTHGVLSFPRITKYTGNVWKDMPEEVANDEDIFEAASANSNRQEVEQAVKEKARAKVYSHPKVSEAVRLAKSAIAIVTSMLATANREIAYLTDKLNTTTEEIVVREGRWSDLRYFTRFPTLLTIGVCIFSAYYLIGQRHFCYFDL